MEQPQGQPGGAGGIRDGMREWIIMSKERKIINVQ